MNVNHIPPDHKSVIAGIQHNAYLHPIGKSGLLCQWQADPIEPIFNLRITDDVSLCRCAKNQADDEKNRDNAARGYSVQQRGGVCRYRHDYSHKM